MLTPWKPTRGWLGSGRFDYGTYYTIRNPHFHLIAADGTIVGAIQWLSGEDGVLQVGEDKPMTLTSTLLYHFTNYGKGYAAGADMSALRSAAFYCFGPDQLELVEGIASVDKVREYRPC